MVVVRNLNYPSSLGRIALGIAVRIRREEVASMCMIECYVYVLVCDLLSLMVVGKGVDCRYIGI